MPSTLQNTTTVATSVATTLQNLTAAAENQDPKALFAAWTQLQQQGGSLLKDGQGLPADVKAKFVALNSQLKTAKTPEDFMNIYMNNKAELDSVVQSLQQLVAVAQALGKEVVQDVGALIDDAKTPSDELKKTFVANDLEFHTVLKNATGGDKFVKFFTEGGKVTAGDAKAIVHFLKEVAANIAHHHHAADLSNEILSKPATSSGHSSSSSSTSTANTATQSASNAASNSTPETEPTVVTPVAQNVAAAPKTMVATPVSQDAMAIAKAASVNAASSSASAGSTASQPTSNVPAPADNLSPSTPLTPPLVAPSLHPAAATTASATNLATNTPPAPPASVTAPEIAPVVEPTPPVAIPSVLTNAPLITPLTTPSVLPAAANVVLAAANANPVPITPERPSPEGQHELNIGFDFDVQSYDAII